jgi:hypothetical protein
MGCRIESITQLYPQRGNLWRQCGYPQISPQFWVRDLSQLMGSPNLTEITLHRIIEKARPAIDREASFGWPG